MEVDFFIQESEVLQYLKDTNTDNWIQELETIQIPDSANQEVFDLRNLLLQCKAMLEEESCKKQIVWILELGDPVFIESNKNNLSAVFLHILSNAIQYNHIGGKISITLREQESNYQVSIQDTGLGMEPETLNTIFDIHPNQKNPYGISMGLSICKEWMDTIGGTIQIQSKVNQGTIVMVGIPKALVRFK